MTKVRLRRKTISNNRQSLYLEIYPPIYNPKTGIMQRKQYLKLYIDNSAKTSVGRELNKETLKLAEHIRAQRQIDLQNRKFDFISESNMKSNFVDFFEEQAEKRKNCYNWQMSVRYFKSFAGSKVPFTELNETLCEEYADYLLDGPSLGRSKIKIKKNTAVAYFGRFKLTLQEAFKKRYIPTNLASIIESISPQETHRPFLFMEELDSLANAYCPNEIVKKAGLFSATTGFRYSDVETLLWKEIHGSEGNYYILYNQEKTGSAEYYPVSDQTIKLLGHPGEPEAKVFDGLKYDQTVHALKKWLLNAGIKKHFTFHGFRHTFATLQIAAGTEIYTVSKLLGHKEIKTTQIYAKIVDSLKKKASEKIKINFYDISKEIAKRQKPDDATE